MNSPKQRQQRHSVREALEKLSSSPVFNGGFDSLMFKVEKIEETQGHLITKIDAIHEAIYEPDNGVFARIKVAENVHKQDELKVEQQLVETNGWKQQIDTDLKDGQVRVQAVEDRLDKTGEQQRELSKWQRKVSSMVKWTVITLGGSIVGLVFKLLYDFISGHIKIN